MVEWCCVKGCDNNTGKTKNRSLRFFRFPAWKRTFGPQMEDITGRRRLAWVAAVRRKHITFNYIAPHIRICSLHFHKGKPAYEMMENDPDWAPSLYLGNDANPTDSERRIHWERLRNDMMLEEAEREINWEEVVDDDGGGGHADEQRDKPSYEMFETHADWAPSLHLGHSEVKPSSQDHYDRLKQRNVINAPIPPTHPEAIKEEEVETVIVGGPQNLVDKTAIAECENCMQKTAEMKRIEEEIQSIKSDRKNECNFCRMKQSEIKRLMDENKVLKQELERWRLEEQFLKDDREKVKYYTGLPGFEALMTLLSFVAPFLPQNYKGISCFQMFFMTLIRLRLNLPVQHVYHLFRKERNVMATVFGNTISALNAHCNNLLQWPSREEIRASLLEQAKEDFQGRVAIYLDCLEMTLTSLCKQPNLKYLISYNPKGKVTFVSKGFQATVSDEHIIKKSGILDKLLPGDYIVSDQCFVVEHDGLKIVPKQSAVAKIFSRQKVFVKRLTINLRRKYTILSAPVLPSMVHQIEGEEMTTLDKIVKVCCALRSIPGSTETDMPEPTETGST